MKWVLGILASLTVLAGSLPFGLYGVARATGQLSAQDEWFRTDPATGFVATNHGPWYGEPMHYVIASCLLGLLPLMFATLLTGVGWSVAEHKARRLLPFAAILLVQCLFFYAQIQTIFWTID